MYKFLCQHMISVLLGMFLGVEMLGYNAKAMFKFEELPKGFPNWLYHFIYISYTIFIMCVC
jgi:hypothetical protein